MRIRRWIVGAIVAAAGLTGGAAANSGLTETTSHQQATGQAGPGQTLAAQASPSSEADSLEQSTGPEQTDALPAGPDAGGSEKPIESDGGSIPAPDVIEPATPATALSSPEPTTPGADAGAGPDADPATLPDGDKAPQQPSKNEASPLRFGVLATGRGPNFAAALQPLTSLLAEKTGRPVEILPMVSYRAMIDAQTLRRIDGGLFSASAYAAADAMCDCLEPLAAPAAADGSTAYEALIVTKADSGIAAVSGLEGKVVATAESSSVGARRMQLAGLMAEGFDIRTFFGRVRTMPSAADAVRLVLEGEADAAFAWGPVSEESSGSEQGTLQQLSATGELTPGALNVIWRSPPLGHGPFAVAKTLPDEAKQAIRDALVSLAGAEPAAYDALSPIYGGGFVAVEPSAYRGAALLAGQNVDGARPAEAAEATVRRFQPQAPVQQ